MTFDERVEVHRVDMQPRSRNLGGKLCDKVLVEAERVSGFRFRVQGSGFRVQGPGFRVQGSGFRVQGSGFRVQSSYG